MAETLPRTVILDDGEVVADGPSAELLRDDALLEAHGLESPFRLPGARGLRRPRLSAQAAPGSVD